MVFNRNNKRNGSTERTSGGSRRKKKGVPGLGWSELVGSSGGQIDEVCALDSVHQA